MSQDDFIKGLQARVDSLNNAWDKEYDAQNGGAEIDAQDDGEEMIALIQNLKNELEDNPDMLLDLAAEMNNQT